jgi:hypothetical protein
MIIYIVLMIGWNLVISMFSFVSPLCQKNFLMKFGGFFRFLKFLGDGEGAESGEEVVQDDNGLVLDAWV